LDWTTKTTCRCIWSTRPRTSYTWGCSLLFSRGKTLSYILPLRFPFYTTQSSSLCFHISFPCRDLRHGLGLRRRRAPLGIALYLVLRVLHHLDLPLLGMERGEGDEVNLWRSLGARGPGVLRRTPTEDWVVIEVMLIFKLRLWLCIACARNDMVDYAW
jgi:hypothetical protein